MILASQSPRRRELLEQIGVRFSIEAADIDETPFPDEGAVAYVERMALEKARVIATRYPGEVVLGSDTSVIWCDRILGKPANNQDAEETLRGLSGQTHEVLSAVAIVKGQVKGQVQEPSRELLQGTRERVISVATKVTFRNLSDDEIRAYVATGEPADKAGSYGIQGKGAILVAAIQGSYSNVVGLPLTETAELLKEFDVPVWQAD